MRNDQSSQHLVCFATEQCRLCQADGEWRQFVTTDGTNASWSNIYGTPTIISTNTNAVNGGFYTLTASLTLTLPATPVW